MTLNVNLGESETFFILVPRAEVPHVSGSYLKSQCIYRHRIKLDADSYGVSSHLILSGGVIPVMIFKIMSIYL